MTFLGAHVIACSPSGLAEGDGADTVKGLCAEGQVYDLGEIEIWLPGKRQSVCLRGAGLKFCEFKRITHRDCQGQQRNCSKHRGGSGLDVGPWS